MPFRVTFFFKQQSSLEGGWSENFWNSSLDLTGANASTDLLRPFLQLIHGDQSVLTNERISDADNFRAVQMSDVISTPDPDLTKATTSDYPTTALLIKLRSANQKVTRQWIKGLPDNVTRRAGRFDPVAAYIPRINAFFAELTRPAAAWAMRVLDGTQVKKIVQAVTQQGVCSVTAHGYATNDKVRISRARNLTQLNQIWRVTNIDANSFSLQGWVDPAVQTPYLGNGTVQKQVYSFVPIQEALVVRATSHRVGRPFGLLGGRRRTRRI